MDVMPLEIFIVLFCYFQATKNILLQAVMVWTQIWGLGVFLCSMKEYLKAVFRI